ncbi:hypothetical protein [Rugamonas sp. DEMB1]|uniref:hypothetical protein n=1 Tax=Rugamonas sp. DEMB1 TaxID=3039386 RepID=UPI00244C127D|nr:hypothetical protein [Rugamonas sp. DEMB1]WGG48513.1 hypothetical protein QC826_17655 [Rugamonas sp. DEMB1]
MGTSPDKDYIDAKSQAVSASVSGEIKAFRAEVNARLAEVNWRFGLTLSLSVPTFMLRHIAEKAGAAAPAPAPAVIAPQTTPPAAPAKAAPNGLSRPSAWPAR